MGKNEENARNIYLELAKLSHDAFKSRRQYEWKINFSFWGAIGLAIYFININRYKIHIDANIFGLMLLLVLFSYGYIQYKLGKADEEDKEWKHYFMAKAEGVKKDRPKDKTLNNWDNFLWKIAQIIFTIILLLFLFFLYK